ncbi:uncharacterized protein B0H18DRAFT_1000354 [Fomitopsis serialis]|uniref:uncharacterized protein n=1 Tax=Fomitopsis serialis TaxID=139415 RepID=UPI002008349B|nr:uncharacterized protein B0H18DRAFT_1052242 [Neoantrodia serialis]XP_047894951.1 uncharacterized protein B0H18DRAFT_1000354 [Neoantrodia serialis]KAH9912734.1 hypothetical protein B0H18DRAFT_1052242 [Neoantrodia serialis]KAH9928724.1 hypothetical protein B0H18DRAFT_1000354 [Neoantrodia serialis]
MVEVGRFVISRNATASVRSSRNSDIHALISWAIEDRVGRLTQMSDNRGIPAPPALDRLASPHGLAEAKAGCALHLVWSLRTWLMRLLHHPRVMYCVDGTSENCCRSVGRPRRAVCRPGGSVSRDDRNQAPRSVESRSRARAGRARRSTSDARRCWHPATREWLTRQTSSCRFGCMRQPSQGARRRTRERTRVARPGVVRCVGQIGAQA